MFATLYTVAHRAPLSMGFCRQEYWSVFPCPPPGDLPNPGIDYHLVLVVKNCSADAGQVRDVSLSPGLGRSPVGGHGNPL